MILMNLVCEYLSSDHVRMLTFVCNSTTSINSHSINAGQQRSGTLTFLEAYIEVKRKAEESDYQNALTTMDSKVL